MQHFKHSREFCQFHLLHWDLNIEHLASARSDGAAGLRCLAAFQLQLERLK